MAGRLGVVPVFLLIWASLATTGERTASANFAQAERIPAIGNTQIGSVNPRIGDREWSRATLRVPSLS